MKKICKIALGDLRHETIGRHFVYTPIGIGYIAAYLLSQADLANKIEVRLYTAPNNLLNDIDSWVPDVVGLTNYCWNSSLVDIVCRYAKKINQDVLCVQGGPEFPLDVEECKTYLIDRPEMDYYVYGHGEQAFTELIRRFYGVNWNVNKLKNQIIDGMMCVNSQTGELLAGAPIELFKDMDNIPSPYLSGLLDDYLKDSFIPAIETSRGCPFTCAYCHEGDENHNKVSSFSVGRIKDELSYIQKIVQHVHGSSATLTMYDSNFGMYKKDVEIAEHIATLIKKYDWPKSIRVSTGKENRDQSVSISKLTNHRIPVSLSLQSLNEDTLKAIKRTNLNRDNYMELVEEFKKEGKPIKCEVIIPMPEETKQTFLEGQKFLIEASVLPLTYTLMLLKGTLLASADYREKYAMKTKYRVLPRQFGVYCGEKCFEVEEVCIETGTMSFEEYIECREFAFLTEIYSSYNFEIIHRHLKELNLSFFEYIQEMFKVIRTENTFITELLTRFKKETIGELFDSKEEIFSYYSIEENYQKLLRGEIGDNIMRKYLAEFFSLDTHLIFDFSYLILKKIAGNKINPKVSDSLEAAKLWATAVFTVNSVFHNVSTVDEVQYLELLYDIQSWFENKIDFCPLITFEQPVVYKIAYDFNKIHGIISEYETMYGHDTSFKFGKFFQNRDIKELWRDCVKTI